MFNPNRLNSSRRGIHHASAHMLHNNYDHPSFGHLVIYHCLANLPYCD